MVGGSIGKIVDAYPRTLTQTGGPRMVSNSALNRPMEPPITAPLVVKPRQ